MGGKAHRRQRGHHQGGEGQVVEPDDGQITGDGQSEAVRGGVGTGGQVVVVADDRGHRAVVAQPGQYQFPRPRTVEGNGQAPPPHAAVRPEPAVESLGALRERPGVALRTDMQDVLVPQPDEVVHGGAHPGTDVHGDRADAGVRVAVEGDHGDAVPQHVDAPGGHGTGENTVDGLPGRGERALPVLALEGVDDHPDPVVGADAGRSAVHIGEMGVRQGRHDQHHRAGPA